MDQPHPNSRRPYGGLAPCLVALLLCAPWTARLNAAVITNVVVANVTPSSFTVVWRGPASAPTVQVFADAAGTLDLSTTLTVQSFPLHTGNPDSERGFHRRGSQATLREKTRAANLSVVQVSGCKPGTTYFFRLKSVPAVGEPVVYPVTGGLPSVKTEVENTLVVDDEQLTIEVPGIDTSGQVAILTHPAARHALAAVVGDGCGTNQVIFNLNDLFAAAGAANFAPVGSQTFDVSVMGPAASDTRAQFTVNFGTDFVVGGNTHVSLGTEFVSCVVGSSVVRVGEQTTIPLDFNSSAAVSRLDLTLRIPPGRLQDLSLVGLAADVDPILSTVSIQNATNLTLTLRARTGQTLFGQKRIGSLSLRASPAQDSAFVPLVLNQIAAARADSSLISSLFGSSGRLVIVGESSLLEAGPQTQGNRSLTLYAKPFSSVALEYSTSIHQPNWTRLAPIPVTNLVTQVIAWNKPQSQLFYRSVEFFADPPLLQPALREDGSRWLTLFGKPGHTYSILSGDLITPSATWPEAFQTTLTNSFAILPALGANTIFYDVRKLAPVGGPSLQMTLGPDGIPQFTLNGRVGTSCLIETAPLSSPSAWAPVLRVPMTSTSVAVPQLSATAAGALYRASEFTANPPLLEALRQPGQSRRLLLYGQPAATYTLEYSTNFSNAVWAPSSTTTLDASFTYISVTNSSGTVFFRVKRH